MTRAIKIAVFICFYILHSQSEGEKIFKQYCTPCHRSDDKKLVGPGLAGVTQRVPSFDWFVKFVKNSQELINAKDSYAVKIFEKYDQVIMPPQPLTDEQIKQVWEWLKTLSAPSTSPQAQLVQSSAQKEKSGEPATQTLEPPKLSVLHYILIVLCVALAILIIFKTLRISKLSKGE